MQTLSLKARAVRILSRREHSRVELARKLAPHAESAEQVQSVIDDLQRQGFFSEERFAQSFAKRRGEKFGTQRVKLELGIHQLHPELSLTVLNELKSTEFERALAVWQRKFGHLEADPDDFASRAKQHQFLLQRGFSSDSIRQVFKLKKSE
jgi:regulatory protein